MDQVNLKLSVAPFYFVTVANMASVTLLRMLKSSISQYLDVETARETFFLGVNIIKRLSVESEDIAAKMVLILTQLWNSDQVFKRPDGSEHTALRIRTRLAMSPVFGKPLRSELSCSCLSFPLHFTPLALVTF